MRSAWNRNTLDGSDTRSSCASMVCGISARNSSVDSSDSWCWLLAYSATWRAKERSLYFRSPSQAASPTEKGGVGCVECGCFLFGAPGWGARRGGGGGGGLAPTRDSSTTLELESLPPEHN